MLAIILVVSYLPLYLPRLTRSHTHCVLLTIVLAAGTLIDIVLVTVYCTTSQCLCHSERCANHVKARHHTRHVVLPIVLAASILIAILLIVIVLIASCSLRCTHCVVLIALCSSCLTHSVVLIASYSTCRIVFANVSLFPCEVW